MQNEIGCTTSGSAAKTVARKPSGSTIDFAALSAGSGPGVESAASTSAGTARPRTSIHFFMRRPPGVGLVTRVCSGEPGTFSSYRAAGRDATAGNSLEAHERGSGKRVAGLAPAVRLVGINLAARYAIVQGVPDDHPETSRIARPPLQGGGLMLARGGD